MNRSSSLRVIGLIIAVCGFAAHSARAQNLTLVVNPRTGQTKIQNAGNGAVNMDGYLLGASGSLNPAGWSSLQDQGVVGWREGAAGSNHLAETNLLSSKTLGVGAFQNLAAAYSPFVPSAIGQPEPAVTFDFHVAGGGSYRGDVLFSPANNLVLVVNPDTGAASIQNQSNFSVTIDGYFISSPTGVLSSSGWTSFLDSGNSGWREGAAGVNHLSEVNLGGSRAMPANGAPVPIGIPVNAAALTDQSDLTFDFHIAGGNTVRGSVAFSLAATPLEGDFDADGDVDGTDFLTWQRGFGSAFNAVDLVNWKGQFGMVAGVATSADFGAAQPVPEPCATAVWMTVALTAAVARSKGVL